MIWFGVVVLGELLFLECELVVLFGVSRDMVCEVICEFVDIGYLLL